LAQAEMDKNKYLGTYGIVGVADSAEDVAMIVYATQMNIASLKESGFDYNIKYHLDIGAAAIGIYFTGTYLIEYASQGAPSINYENQLGKYNPTGTPVSLQARQGGWLKWNNIDINLTVNYTHHYECDVCYIESSNGVTITEKSIPIDSWATIDINLGLDLSKYDHAFLKGMYASLIVTNVFNKSAPFIDASTGIDDAIPDAYDFANATMIGRTVSLQLTQTW
jgi:outer membrane receptor protein involved in Fe transport